MCFVCVCCLRAGTLAGEDKVSPSDRSLSVLQELQSRQQQVWSVEFTTHGERERERGAGGGGGGFNVKSKQTRIVSFSLQVGPACSSPSCYPTTESVSCVSIHSLYVCKQKQSCLWNFLLRVLSPSPSLSCCMKRLLRLHRVCCVSWRQKYTQDMFLRKPPHSELGKLSPRNHSTESLSDVYMHIYACMIGRKLYCNILFKSLSIVVTYPGEKQQSATTKSKEKIEDKEKKR